MPPMFWIIIDADASLSAATKFSVPKAVMDVYLGHMHRRKLENTYEGVKVSAVFAGWSTSTISPGFLRYICVVFLVKG